MYIYTYIYIHTTQTHHMFMFHVSQLSGKWYYCYIIDNINILSKAACEDVITDDILAESVWNVFCWHYDIWKRVWNVYLNIREDWGN